MDNIPVVKIIDEWAEFKEYMETANVYKTKEGAPPADMPILWDPKEMNMRFYRGHSHKNYSLQSTLERYIGNDVTREQFDKIQIEFLHLSKQTFAGKIQEQFILFDNRFDNEVWAIGQHYGLKTPLLDWTKSFWVALYFAFEELKSDSDYRVIYSLNQFMSESRFPIIKPRIDLGGRLYAQKGVFTNLLAKEIEERNQAYLFPDGIEREPPITKIYISSGLRNEIMEFLHSINIHGATLFPDIYGAIKDCHAGLDEIIYWNT